MSWRLLKLLGFFLASFIILYGLLSVFDRPTYFSQPWKQEIDTQNARKEQKRQAKASEKESTSTQPRAPGFKESDMKKYPGHRYQTF